uniref:Dynein light chain roadblock n=1 Tax=Chromera velia CCMP2878 TaxID=1169474 RepID=A0A0G4G2D1_9ALVE|mmetsp:Transcript_32243/g.63991  ORF Transcript_32243/g.63991 Transcript_32243/m.63991 type:complete len:105 (-) Transcript_32243:303-617(-)|eukprot:Cvel_19929.t1-p1 / transcript=Cvel_19929.t1 / gene=Cvel_19929 / organism=Chromera_velia_CCMP2878 / gene_product=Dynein light chain roadblock-type 2, putative / transcript_product=Dynein light chain roadblock-type 2, putative / location=Cvel_scaffold1753:30141-32524(+) / protein_length=104 / sequence_SO=supercontig / SO=protein_coding / is_pseudo=false
MSEIEEALERIQNHKGVSGVVIVNHEGKPLRASRSLEGEPAKGYADLISQLTWKARSLVRDLDPQNALTFLRVRAKKSEILVAPDREFILIVIQDPTAEAAGPG